MLYAKGSRAILSHPTNPNRDCRGPDSGGPALDGLTHLDRSLAGQGLSRAFVSLFGCRDQGLAGVDHLPAGDLEQMSALKRLPGQYSQFLAAQVALLTCYVRDLGDTVGAHRRFDLAPGRGSCPVNSSSMRFSEAAARDFRQRVASSGGADPQIRLVSWTKR